MNKLIFLLLLVFGLGIVIWFGISQQDGQLQPSMTPSPVSSPSPVVGTPDEPDLSLDDIQALFENQGGTWLEEHAECEAASSDAGLSEDQCQELGGSYASCASPCRHNPERACIQVCYSVCSFK